MNVPMVAFRHPLLDPIGSSPLCGKGCVVAFNRIPATNLEALSAGTATPADDLDSGKRQLILWHPQS